MTVGAGQWCDTRSAERIEARRERHSKLMRFTRALTEGYALCLARPPAPPPFFETVKAVSLIHDIRHVIRTLLFQSTTEITPYDDGVRDGDNEQENRDDGCNDS